MGAFTDIRRAHPNNQSNQCIHVVIPSTPSTPISLGLHSASSVGQTLLTGSSVVLFPRLEDARKLRTRNKSLRSGLGLTDGHVDNIREARSKAEMGKASGCLNPCFSDMSGALCRCDTGNNLSYPPRIFRKPNQPAKPLVLQNS